jgi:hypothetical protein
MANGMTRPSDLYGRKGSKGRPDSKGRLGIGRSKFYKDYVYKIGGEQFIPGTTVPRLKLVNLGERALAALDDEVDALIEALRAERDANLRKRAA